SPSHLPKRSFHVLYARPPNVPPRLNHHPPTLISPLSLHDALPIRPSRRRSHSANDPRPGTTPVARSATTPPSVSPASRAAAIAAIIALLRSGSALRTSLASTASRSTRGSLTTSPTDFVSFATPVPPPPHAAGDAHRIALYAPPRATAVSELPAAQVEIDLRGRHCETGGDAVQDGEDHRPVGLAGGQEPHTRRGRAARMTSSGAGTP